jgi:hypothetical protein
MEVAQRLLSFTRLGASHQTASIGTSVGIMNLFATTTADQALS